MKISTKAAFALLAATMLTGTAQAEDGFRLQLRGDAD